MGSDLIPCSSMNSTTGSGSEKAEGMDGGLCDIQCWIQLGDAFLVGVC